MANDKHEIANLIEDTIARSAQTAEQIHRSVADLSGSVLEGAGFGDKSSEELRRIQETSIGAIYNLVREVNHSVADLARDIITRVDEAEAAKKPD